MGGEVQANCNNRVKFVKLVDYLKVLKSKLESKMI